MGEVDKARDTRLDRTVATKVLPEQFAADPTLKQQFEREAQTVAALNHPHICTLYDIGRAIPQGPHPGPLPDGEGGSVKEAPCILVGIRRAKADGTLIRIVRTALKLYRISDTDEQDE